MNNNEILKSNVNIYYGIVTYDKNSMKVYKDINTRIIRNCGLDIT